VPADISTTRRNLMSLQLLVGPSIGPHDTSGLREAVGIRIAAEGTAGENTVMDDKRIADSPS
jgi:hypothetical protein